MQSNAQSMPFSKTWCVLPWIHTATLTDGSTQLCCVAEETSNINLNNGSLSEFWNSDHAKDTRIKMLSGEQVASCRRCYQEEESGHVSHRMIENGNWSEKLGSSEIEKIVALTKEDGTLDSGIISVDLRLGNNCNLQCIMCQPRDSTKWVAGSEKLIPHLSSPDLVSEWTYKKNINYSLYQWYKNKKFWDNLFELLPTVREIIIAGGEPMIIKEHLEFIKRCSETEYAAKIHIRYHTNLVDFPVHMLPFWEKFEKVEILGSTDGLNEIANYIRYPSQWKVVEENISIIDETSSNIWFRFLFSVQALNIAHLPDFIRWVNKKNYKKSKYFYHTQFFVRPGLVHWPLYLNPKILPVDQKKKITSDFLSLKEELNEPFEDYEGIVNFMNSEDLSSNLPRLKEYLAALDRVRMTNYKSVFPDLLSDA